MKYCPACRQRYSDLTLNFCLSDGTPLEGDMHSAETVVIPAPRVTRDVTPRQGVSPIFAYLTIGLVCLLVGGGAIYLITASNRTGQTSDQISPRPTSTPTNVNISEPDKTPVTLRTPTPSKPDPETRSPTVASGNTHFVILGSFPASETPRAQERLQAAQTKGFPAHLINSSDYPGLRSGLTCVVLGPFTKSEAQQKLTSVRGTVKDAYIKSGW